jgi:hypothetical protein
MTGEDKVMQSLCHWRDSAFSPLVQKVERMSDRRVPMDHMVDVLAVHVAVRAYALVRCAWVMPVVWALLLAGLMCVDVAIQVYVLVRSFCGWLNALPARFVAYLKSRAYAFLIESGINESVQPKAEVSEMEYPIGGGAYITIRGFGRTQTESVQERSPFIPMQMPKWEVEIKKELDGKTHHVGKGFRFNNYLVTPAHVLAHNNLYVVGASGKMVELDRSEEDLSYDVDLAIVTLPQNVWARLGVSNAKLYQGNYRGGAQIAGPAGMGSSAAVVNHPLMDRIGYEGSTVGGFSGATYHAANTVYGMHTTGSATGNSGYSSAFLRAVLRHKIAKALKQQDSKMEDSYDVIERCAELVKRGRKFLVKHFPNEITYVLFPDGSSEMVDTDEFQERFQQDEWEVCQQMDDMYEIGVYESAAVVAEPEDFSQAAAAMASASAKPVPAVSVPAPKTSQASRSETGNAQPKRDPSKQKRMTALSKAMRRAGRNLALAKKHGDHTRCRQLEEKLNRLRLQRTQL